MNKLSFGRRVFRSITAVAAALAATAALTLGASATASAGTVPPGGTSTVFTITNQTGGQLFLRDSRVDFGGWIDAPWGFMNPGDTQTVIAHSPNPIGIGVTVRYDTVLHGGGTIYTTTANQIFGFPWFGDSGATRGGGVGHHLFTPGPHLNAEFTLY